MLKILVFSLVSEKESNVKVTRAKVKVTGVKVKGRKSMPKVARVKVVGQGHMVKVEVKLVGGSFLPHRLVGDVTHRRFHSTINGVSCNIFQQVPMEV